MSSYEGLAASYDALTTDVGYEKRGGFLGTTFPVQAVPPSTRCWIWPAAPAP